MKKDDMKLLKALAYKSGNGAAIFAWNRVRDHIVESAKPAPNKPTTPCQEAHSEYKSRFEWFYCPLCGIKL